MDCTIQPWNPRSIKGLLAEDRQEHKKSGHRSCDLLWKDYFRDPSQLWDNRSSKVGTVYPHFQHKSSMECFWIDGLYNPPWVGEELRRKGVAMSTQAPFEKTEKGIRDKRIFGHDERSAFVALLRACAKNKDLSGGTRVHGDILQRGLLEKCSDALVTMYAKCGALVKAKELLDMHESRNVVSWTALISGYVRQGQGQDALNCFEWMQREGISPDAVTFSCILKACGSLKAADKGEQIHDEIVRRGLLGGDDVVLGNALVDMYSRCGALAKAQEVLEDLPSRDVVSWSSLIAGYVQLGQGEQALACFERMQGEGISPDAVTFTCILKACGTIGAADKGAKIHEEIARQGLLESDIVLGNALVDMYAKCHALGKAQQVLEELPSRDVISWNALIAGYAQDGQGEQALTCFRQMQCEGLSPNAVTFTCVLKACGTIGAINDGEQIHEKISRQGLLRNNIVLGTALVDMYATCGALVKARQVLEELPSRDVLCWSALIAGYTRHGQGEKALSCFKQMQCEGLTPDAMTFACILKACGAIGAADKGEQIHDEITRQGLLGNNVVLGTALVDMYAKCGALAKAQQVFEELPSRNVNSWTALITGYAQKGLGQDALISFERMQREGLSPDAVTLSCVLNTCNHLGLVEDGHTHFVSMSTKFGMKPSKEHYTCMVDLFGRSGHLDKAVRVIQEMPSSDYSAVWVPLLSACQKWGDVDVGRWAFDQAIQVDKGDASPYILMANIYAAAGMQEDAKIIEAMRMENKV